MEYFTDREKNFYLNLVHVNLTSLIATTIVAVGTMQVAQHICGMFRIARYVHENVVFLLHWNNRRKIYKNDGQFVHILIKFLLININQFISKS